MKDYSGARPLYRGHDDTIQRLLCSLPVPGVWGYLRVTLSNVSIVTRSTYGGVATPSLRCWHLNIDALLTKGAMVPQATARLAAAGLHMLVSRRRLKDLITHESRYSPGAGPAMVHTVTKADPFLGRSRVRFRVPPWVSNTIARDHLA